MITQEQLDQFTGTLNYWRHPIFPRMAYTDGIQYMAKEAEAYWLVDFVFAHQLDAPIRDYRKTDNFQVWKLTVNDDNTAKMVVEDGNLNVIATYEIGYTDFPLKKIEMFLQNDVLFLPSEY